MPASKKIIRKTDAHRLADFDDQLWPVNCAILILAGVVAGIALATGDFHSSDPLENTTLRLILIAIATVLLFAGSLWLDGRLVRRLQLCVLISLMVHLWLGIYLHQRYITLMAALEKDKPVEQLVEDDPRLVVPEYHWQRIERPLSRPSFEQPTKTEAKRAADPEPVEQRQIEHAVRSKKPEVKPETPQQQQPKPAEMQRAELTAPRRAKLAAGAQISRQEWKQKPQPNEPVTQPNLPQASRAAELQQNKLDPLQRKATQSPPQQRQVFDVKPADRKTRQPLKLARRAVGRQQPQQTPSTPTPSRMLSRPTDLAEEQVAMPSPAPTTADFHAQNIQAAADASSVSQKQVAVAAATASNSAAQFNVSPAPVTPAQHTAKTTNAERPSLATGGPSAPLSRSSTPAASQLASGLAAEAALTGMPEASQPAASASGDARQLTQNTKATTVARGGAAVAPNGSRAIGAGPSGGSPSAADRIGVARRARVTRNESTSTGVSGGGGSSSPARTPGRSLAALSTNELPQIAAVGDATGPANAQPDGQTAGGSSAALQTGPETSIRQTAATAPVSLRGTPGSSLPSGSSADTADNRSAMAAAAAASSTPGLTSGPRRFAHGNETGPTLAAEVGAGPLRKTSTPGLLPGIVETIQPDALASDGPQGSATSDRPQTADLVAGSTDAPPQRQTGGLPVRIAAAAGPGGLSYEPSPEIGIPTRRARPESETVHTMARRFLVERSGGRLPVDGSVQELATAAFRQRDPGKRARAVEVYGGSEGTERAVEMGLEFFVRHQFPDGHWSLDRHKQKGDAYKNAGWTNTSSDSAATGLALLSFFGAGYTHQSDKHRDTVRRGIDWLVKSQKENGDLFVGGTDYTWFYSHGIATIALCEAYGMTNDAELREPAQKAVAFIIESQHPQRGGWRYKPRVESDTSVSGWQLMALKSAQMAGLKVPPETFEKVTTWLDTAQAGDGSRFVYNPNAPNTDQQREGRRPNLAMTAEGTLMRMYLGRKSDDPITVNAADHLAENLPEISNRDAYYWYYATQVMFHMQGDHWKTWNGHLRPLLEKGQVQKGPLSGSWDPKAPVPDRWGHAGGRIYLTALNLLMLEVYYRHLPLFQTLEE